MSPATVTKIKPDPPAVAGDPRIEAWLDTHHVKWRFEPELPLDSIDLKRSLANQARADDEALIPDVVELYTHAYKRGDVFPPILVRETSKRAKKTNLGGNHRTNAAIAAGRTHHPAYIVECTDEAAMVLMIEDNLTNGAQLPKKQRIAIAVHLVATGWEARRAAAEMGVHEAEISNARTLQAATVRARQLDVTRFDDLPQGQCLDLARIGSDPVFAETAKLLAATGMQGTDAAGFIKKVKAAKSDSSALTIIGQELEVRRDEIQRRYGGKSVTNRRRPDTSFDRVRNAVMVITAATPDDVAESAPTPDAAKILKTQLGKELGPAVAKLLKALT